MSLFDHVYGPLATRVIRFFSCRKGRSVLTHPAQCFYNPHVILGRRCKWLLYVTIVTHGRAAYSVNITGCYAVELTVENIFFCPEVAATLENNKYLCASKSYLFFLCSNHFLVAFNMLLMLSSYKSCIENEIQTNLNSKHLSSVDVNAEQEPSSH